MGANCWTDPRLSRLERGFLVLTRRMALPSTRTERPFNIMCIESLPSTKKKQRTYSVDSNETPIQTQPSCTWFHNAASSAHLGWIRSEKRVQMPGARDGLVSQSNVAARMSQLLRRRLLTCAWRMWVCGRRLGSRAGGLTPELQGPKSDAAFVLSANEETPHRRVGNENNREIWVKYETIEQSVKGRVMMEPTEW